MFFSVILVLSLLFVKNVFIIFDFIVYFCYFSKTAFDMSDSVFFGKEKLNFFTFYVIFLLA